ncbi:MAG: hypothetical protein KatS3mg014_0254 [Actinomycetota bacterium]|nr:MAG: hypothetical protein KatS3mg014_0254 [Actinomycetota bacterium]
MARGVPPDPRGGASQQRDGPVGVAPQEVDVARAELGQALEQLRVRGCRGPASTPSPRPRGRGRTAPRRSAPARAGGSPRAATRRSPRARARSASPTAAVGRAGRAGRSGLFRLGVGRPRLPLAASRTDPSYRCWLRGPRLATLRSVEPRRPTPEEPIRVRLERDGERMPPWVVAAARPARAHVPRLAARAGGLPPAPRAHPVAPRGAVPVLRARAGRELARGQGMAARRRHRRRAPRPRACSACSPSARWCRSSSIRCRS